MKKKPHAALRSTVAAGALCLAFPTNPAAADTPGVPEITGFWLVDAATDVRLFELRNFQTLNLAFVPALLTIEVVGDSDTQSMSFTVDSVATPLHNAAPYAISSDTGGDFEPVPSLREPGWTRITATPHAGPNGTGTAGATSERRLYKLKTDFVVDSIGDSSDAQPGDGRCEALELQYNARNAAVTGRSLEAAGTDAVSAQAATSAANTLRGPSIRPTVPVVPPVFEVRKTCTLRAAVEEANARPGRQTVSIDGSNGQIYRLTRGQLSITDGIAIHGNDKPAVDAGRRSRVLDVRGPEGGTMIVDLSDLDLANGVVDSTARGGVISVQRALAQISDSIIRGGDANFGGGMYLQDGGNATLSRTVVKDNTAGSPASFAGGGVTQRGGGIFNLRGNVTIRHSAIVDNIAVRGGGISNHGGLMRIENSSVLDNEARSLGGGIENRHSGDDKGRLHVSFSTITGNRAATSFADPANARTGGGIHNAGWAYMASSILAGNTEEFGTGNPFSSPDCYSPTPYDFKSFRSNIVGVINGNCSFGDYSSGTGAGIRSGTDLSPLNPLLGTRVNSPLPYRMPFPTSPAIDQGGTASAIYPCPAQDSRGRPRPAGAGCDIGAVERQ